MRSVLVTGIGGASGLYTAKILKESGYRVIGADSESFPAGEVIVDKFMSLPSAKEDPQSFDASLINIFDYPPFDVNVVLPNVDDELLAFSRIKDKEYANVIVSDYNTVMCCLDKYLTYTTCESSFLPYTELMSFYHRYLKYTGSSKCVIKPRRGRGSKGIYICDIGDVINYINICRPLDEYIIQDYIFGDEYTIDILYNKENVPIIIAPRKRIRTYGGVSMVGASILPWEGLNILVQALSNNSELKFYGPINMQVIKNNIGTYLVEINPRLSGGIGITYANGINIPDLAIKMYFGEEFEIPTLKEDTVYRYFVEGKVK